MIRTAFCQEGQASARAFWRETSDRLREAMPKVSELMDNAEDDVLAFMDFPKEHWPQLASTNTLERLNKEIKRRSRVVGIFPNDASIMRSRRAAGRADGRVAGWPEVHEPRGSWCCSTPRRAARRH